MISTVIATSIDEGVPEIVHKPAFETLNDQMMINLLFCQAYDGNLLFRPEAILHTNTAIEHDTSCPCTTSLLDEKHECICNIETEVDYLK